MKKNNSAATFTVTLTQLDTDVQKITGVLLDLVHDDQSWWNENINLLISQPLTSLQQHLLSFKDESLDKWKFSTDKDAGFSILDPIEALVWLVALCRLDRILLGVLPRRFADEIDLQWRVLALHWMQ